MCDIWLTGPDSSTITIKQNGQFQVWVRPEKCQLDQIQNDRLVAIIDFNMCNIYKTVLIFPIIMPSICSNPAR